MAWDHIARDADRFRLWSHLSARAREPSPEAGLPLSCREGGRESTVAPAEERLYPAERHGLSVLSGRDTASPHSKSSLLVAANPSGAQRHFQTSKKRWTALIFSTQHLPAAALPSASDPGRLPGALQAGCCCYCESTPRQGGRRLVNSNDTSRLRAGRSRKARRRSNALSPRPLCTCRRSRDDRRRRGGGRRPVPRRGLRARELCAHCSGPFVRFILLDAFFSRVCGGNSRHNICSVCAQMARAAHRAAISWRGTGKRRTSTRMTSMCSNFLLLIPLVHACCAVRSAKPSARR